MKPGQLFVLSYKYNPVFSTGQLTSSTMSKSIDVTNDICLCVGTRWAILYWICAGKLYHAHENDIIAYGFQTIVYTK